MYPNPRFNLPAKKDNSETEMAISAIVAKPYRLQTNDVLSINIKAIDPKLVAIFSTTNEGDPGKSATGLYFDFLRSMIMGISGCLS
jgi:polysaccharide export outer membrane protein